MNHTRKWHKPTGPAFYFGERWEGNGGKVIVTIVSVGKYPGVTSECISDYRVTYTWIDSEGTAVIHDKDAWNFQIRYSHIADRNL